MKKPIVIIFLLLCIITFAQTSEQYKLLEQSTTLIFSNPKKSAQISSKVFAESDNYNIKISALSKLVNAQMVLGNISQVINNCATGIEMAKNNHDKINQIRFLSILGNQYQQINMNLDAKKNLDEAENLINTTTLPKDLLFIKGNVYNIKGIVFKNELNCEFAIKYFDKALAVYNRLPPKDVIATNKLLIEIQKSVCLEALNNNTEAEKLYKKILAEGNQTLGYNKYFAALGLANIYTKSSKLKESDSILNTVNINDFNNLDSELTILFYSLKTRNSYLEKDTNAFLGYFNKYVENTNNMSFNQSKIINQLIKDNRKETEEKIHKNTVDHVLTFIVLLIAFSIIIIFMTRYYSKISKS